MTDFLHYLVWDYLWQGLLITLEVTAVSFVASLALGLVVAEARMSRVRILRAIAGFYIWFIRGTPLLLQLLFIYDALPAFGLTLDAVPTAIIGFTINGAAFLAEIFRGGFSAVGRGQLLAAESLGMTPWTSRRYILLPQAFRVILPSLGNELISLIKSTSVASIISVQELTARAQYEASQTFTYLPVFSATAIIYLLVTSVISAIQFLIERRLDPNRVRGPQSVGAFRRFTGLGLSRASLQTALADPEPVLRAEDVATTDLIASEPPVGPIVPPTPVRPHATDHRSGEIVLDIHGAVKRYGDTEVLHGVDVTVHHGEVVAVLGASGSGKSTMLRLINHLETLDGGSVHVGGLRIGYAADGTPSRSGRVRALDRARARIGMVFQHFDLFEHLTVLDNLTVAPMRVYGVPREAAEARGHELLARVGLAQHAHSMPHTLSGGQQQRVAIARALAIDPLLMLFDEPTSALDPELVGEVLATMRDLAAGGMTMVVVTHEIRFARDVADRVVFMRDGRVVDDGPPDAVLAIHHPSFVATAAATPLEGHHP
jgi:polar amino acid transport system permease protein